MGEPARKIDYPTPAHEHADGLLLDIRGLTDIVENLQSRSQAEVDAIVISYRERIAPVKLALEK